LQDTSGTAAAQAKYAAAATAAQQHANKVQQLLRTTSATTCSSSNVPAGASCWQQVQTAAHHLLSTYRAASMRLQLLSSLLDGREQLLHQIQQAQLDASHSLKQQRPQQQHSSPTRRSGNNSIRCESASVLTAFELHLMASPQLLQQHQQALQQGCVLLQQQLQCVQAAQTFFAWASSVLAEEQNVPAHGTSAEGTTAAAAHVSSSRHAQHKAPPAAAARQQQPVLLPEPKVADLLPLLQQLPAADSPLAAKVLLRVTQQLQAAATQAGIELGTNITSSTAAAAATDALSALSLRSTAGLAVSSSSISSSVKLSDADEAVLSTFGKVAAAAIVASGIVPNAEPGLLQPPADIQQQLDSQTALRLQQQQRKDAGRQEQVTEQLEQHWRRQQVSDQQLQELTAQLQMQQQQQQGVCSAVPDDLLPTRLSSGQAAAAGAPHVAAAAEVQRLHGLALHVARQLAKARAANKQQLQVAGQLLTGQGEAAAAAAAGSADGPGQLLLFKN
jgi:hypothetical protein